MRSIVIALTVTVALSLQGCSTTVGTFALGGLIGAVTGVSALVCTIACR
jgi:uncharacterized protein YceK